MAPLTDAQQQQPTSFVSEVQTGDQRWSSNSLRFPTKASAQTYGQDLQSRWTLVTAIRVMGSSDAVNMDEDCNHLGGTSALKGAGHRVQL